jgi:hypothetical protein
MDSGVATRPIADMDAYVDRLNRFVFRSGLVMKPVFSAAARARPSASSMPTARTSACCARPRCARGRHRRADPDRPALCGRGRLERYGLKIRPGKDFDIVNPEDDPRYRDYVDLLIRRPAVGGSRRRPRAPWCAPTRPSSPPRDAARRGRRHDLRAGRPLRAPPAQCRPADRQARGRERPLGAVDADLAARRHLLHRHLCLGRSRRARDRRDDDAGGRGNPPLRHRAQGGAAVAFQFRLARFAKAR